MTPAEVREMLQARDQKKKDQLVQARADIQASLDEGATMAPGLDEKDIDFLATTRVKLS